MANSTSKPDVQKITVVLPRALLARLEEHVVPRQRSQFIVQAIQDRLALEEQMAALDESAGAWTEANHSDLRTGEDIDRWLTGLRSSWQTEGEHRD